MYLISEEEQRVTTISATFMETINVVLLFRKIENELIARPFQRAATSSKDQ